MLIMNLDAEILDNEQKNRRSMSKEQYYMKLYKQLPKLNDEQQAIFDTIRDGFENAKKRIQNPLSQNPNTNEAIKGYYFLTGEGGAGKTFLLKVY